MRRTTRTTLNQVTGERETVLLDAVQLAFERCTQVIEGKMLDLSAAECTRLADRLAEWLRRCKPHTD